MLVSGKYRLRSGDDWWNRFEMTLSVKETKASYILTMLESSGRFIPSQIEMLFKKSSKVILRKNKGGHPIEAGSDNTWFVIYPFQAGIPFLFELVPNDEGRGE